MGPAYSDKVVRDFGREWASFDQSGANEEDLYVSFRRYFEIFPWTELPPEPRGFDLGCGSGRWARFVAPRVGHLVCLDASSEALGVARRNLAAAPNCDFVLGDASSVPLADASMDFGYSLGVLHHIPDTMAGIRACVRLLKPGAPLLLYLYYRFENRPVWFRATWRATDVARRLISRLPYIPKLLLSQLIAGTVYLPLAMVAKLGARLGMDVSNFPLSFYRNGSFYSMRTDALDRFGTRRERRFTRGEIENMLTQAGLTNVRFSDSEPYWCVVATRPPDGSVKSGCLLLS